MRTFPIALVFALACASSLRADDTNPWTTLGGALAGVQGAPALAGSGPLIAGQSVTLTLSQAAPGALSALVVGANDVSLPLYGGTLIPSPDVVLTPIVTDASGAAILSAPWPAGSVAGTDLFFQYWIADAAGPAGYSASNAIKATTADGPEPGVFPTTWINGSSCGSEPAMQIHAYNPDLYILRQSICTNYEGPFITLIFGGSKVLMLDSGAGNIPIQSIVNGVIQNWLAARGQASIQLIVAHLHAHGDHVAGDSQFTGKPNTTVVGTSQSAVKTFFGITTWPTQIVSYDLGGGRVVDVIPIPGHQSAHIAVYDRRTALLFTGDSLYPGRLYINGAVSQNQFPVFKASIQRLVDFTATRPLCWVIGTHIEMSQTPFQDYPIGAPVHANERELQLTRDHLVELNDALIGMGSTPAYQKHADFIIYPVN